MARGLSAGLARGQNGAAREHHRVERLVGPSRRRAPCRDVAQGLDGALDVAGRGDPAGTEPGRQLPRPRAGRGDVEPDRGLRIDQAELGIEQPDQPGLALDRGFDRLAAQQRHDDPEIVFHLGQPDRAKPHRPPSGEAGADPEIDPPRRQFVQRGKSVRRHRGKPVRRDQDAGAEPDLRRLHRRRGQGRWARERSFDPERAPPISAGYAGKPASSSASRWRSRSLSCR